MNALLELAERCEQATRPDRMLDAAIFEWLITVEGFTPDRVHLPYPQYAFTTSLDAAMMLVPDGIELAIYTNWPLVEQYEPRNDDGSWTAKESTPRGCWVRAYGRSESGGIKNVGPRAHSMALALCAFALRARASA